MSKMNIHTNDQVLVISGEKDKGKGKQAKVLSVDTANNKVVVEGVAMVKRHQKSRAQGQPGGIIDKETAIDVSNVMLVCPKCNKPTRVGHAVVEKVYRDDTKKMKSVRVCKECGAQIDA